MSCRCDPVHVRYKLYADMEHVSATQEQDRNLYWDDINVLLAGWSLQSLYCLNDSQNLIDFF